MYAFLRTETGERFEMRDHLTVSMHVYVCVRVCMTTIEFTQFIRNRLSVFLSLASALTRQLFLCLIRCQSLSLSMLLVFVF